MAQGFLYLIAIMDCYSRYVLSWRLSNTLDAGFCFEALEAALAISEPDIFNTDQVVQFTSKDFTDKLQSCGIQISMDGRGMVFDNIFIERLWRSVKYEEVYVKNYESVPVCEHRSGRRDAVEGLTRYFQLYNMERLHESLGYRTPHEVYFGGNNNNRDNGDACRLIHQIQPIFLS
jgi:putative transposase